LTLESQSEFVAVVRSLGQRQDDDAGFDGSVLPAHEREPLHRRHRHEQLGEPRLAAIAAHRVGFVFQEYNLLSGLNVPRET